MRTTWHIARTDLVRWLRSPALIAATLIPAAGMALMVLGLTYAVGRQPVALVVESHGSAAQRIEALISTSDGFFLVKKTPAEARRDLKAQKVAAVITIPAGFDFKAVAHEGATVDVLINNVDLDFADDIRRSVNEAVVAYNIDAGASLSAEEAAERDAAVSTRPDQDRTAILGSHFRPNPYGLSVDEFDVRHTDTSFLAYQLVPVLALLALTGGALVTALALAAEREAGILDLIRASPAARAGVVAGHLAGGAMGALALLGAVVVPATALGVLHAPPGRWPLVGLILLLTAASATALGVAVGMVCRRAATAVLVGVNVVAGSFLLGGGFTTVAFLPDVVQRFSRLTPTYYSVNALREALFYSRLDDMGHDLVWLAGAVVVSLGAAAAALATSHANKGSAGRRASVPSPDSLGAPTG
jgi:ABC-2 type transport system permease protein